MTAIGPWPPMQYVPDLAATSLGVEAHPDRVRILALLGLAFLLLSVGLARTVLSRAGQAGLFWGFVFVVLTGPLLAYANTSWGEVLASGLLVCLVAAAVLQAPPPVVAVAAFGACLTKETAYPVVAALGLLGLVLARRRTKRPIAHHVAWGAAGVVLAFVVTSLFNVVRFGSVLNTNYLQSEFHTPGVSRKLELAAGLLVSPNGGIFVFWTSASVLLLTACLVPFTPRLRRLHSNLDTRPALVLLLASLGLIFTLASWWTPFGWLAWGPRLTLPWMLPLVLLALVAYGEQLTELARRLVAPMWRLLLVVVAFGALTLPHIGYLWQPEATTARFFSPNDPHCKGRGPFGSARHYSCLREQTWFRRPMLVDALPGLRTTGGVVSSIAVTFGLLGSLILLRQGLQPVGSLREGVRPASRRRRHAAADAPT
jgi:hypothetical protein